GGAARNASVGEDRAGMQPGRLQAAAPVAAARDEDAAPAHRCLLAPGGQSRQVGRDARRRVDLLVPDRDRSLQHVDAVAVRPGLTHARVGLLHVDALQDDMAGHDSVVREDLDLADRAEQDELQRAEALHRRVVEHNTRGRGRAEPQRSDAVVARQLHAVGAVAEDQRCAVVRADEVAAGGEPKGRNPLYGAGDDHVTGTVVGHRPLQLLDRGDLRRCDGHVTPSYITATAGLAVPYTPPVWSRAFDESEEP